MAISSQNPELFRAILAMDAYRRGYGAWRGGLADMHELVAVLWALKNN